MFQREYPNWISSGEMQRREIKNKDGTLATPRTLVRRAEELVEDGKLEVEYRNKGHSFYRFNPAGMSEKERTHQRNLEITRMMRERLQVFN